MITQEFKTKIDILLGEDCLREIFKLFKIEYVALNNITMDSSELKQLKNEYLPNVKSNKFLKKWDKVKPSLLEFMYFPFVLNDKGNLISGRHRFD